MKQYTTGPNDEGLRLSRFVLRVTRGLPDTLMYKGFRNGRIKVDGRKAKPDQRLATGQLVQLYLNDEFFPEPDGPAAAPGAPLPDYGTIYQDHGIAVLYKPAGVLSHRDTRGRPGLLDAFTANLARQGLYHPAGENTFAPALCNRLDRGTEGLVLAATTARALRDANEVIRLGLLAKTYLCACVGTPPQGTHQAYLARDRAAKTVAVSTGEAPGAKPITTGVTVLGQHGGLSLCQIELLTGRTHQIRAHLAFLGAPILGDRKYGGDQTGLPQPPHQALCAWRLVFGAALPQESSLAPLAGQTFTAQQARLPAWWRQFCAG